MTKRVGTLLSVRAVIAAVNKQALVGFNTKILGRVTMAIGNRDTNRLALAAIAAVSLLVIAHPVQAATNSWTNTSTDQLWSTNANWSPAGPVASNDIIFGNTGFNATAGTVTNIVDANTSVNSLNYNNTGTNTQTTQINTGVTLTVTGAIANAFAVHNGPSDSLISNVTITGGGSLLVNGGTTTTTFAIGAAQSNAGNLTQILNMSGLANFTATVSAVNLGTGIRGGATVTLAANNSITATNIALGGNTGTGGPLTTLNLGQANTINAGTISIGSGRSSGLVQFATGLSSPTATIRGAAGGSSAATLNIGTPGTNASGVGSGALDFTGAGSSVGGASGVAGSVDAIFSTVSLGGPATGTGTGSATGTLNFGLGTITATTMTLGIGSNGTSTTAPAPNTGTGIVTMSSNAGTLTAATVTVGSQTNAGTTVTSNAVGQFNQNGGTAVITTLNIGQRTAANTAAASGGNVTGTYTLANSGILKANVIQPGASNGTGVGTVSRAFNWSGGTIQNLNSSTDLTITSGTGNALVWTLSSGSAKSFTADANRTITFNGNGLTGSDGFSKDGLGTLIFTGNNSGFTGSINVNAGTMLVNGSLGALTVNSGGKLGGSGTVGDVTVSSGTGTVANGTGGVNTSTLTLNSLNFQGTGALNFSLVDANTAGIVTTNGLTTSGGSNSVTVNTSNVLTLGTTYKLLNFGTGFSGNLTDFTYAQATARKIPTFGTSGSFITLQVNGDTPKWTGLDNGNWVVGSTGPLENWKLVTAGTKTAYIEGDDVLFDDTATGTKNVSISAANVSPGSTTFNNTAAYTLSSSGGFGIAGTGGLAKSGTGTVTITTANTYSGATTINAGTLQLGNGTTDGSIALTSSVTNNGTLAYNLVGPQSAPYTISGTGAVTKSGAGALTLGAANSSYTGATTINGGTLSVATLANGGANSSIGASTNVAANLVINGATLQYTGAGNSTDRNFTIGDSSATLDASGGGALTISGTASFVTPDLARTLTLTGSGTATNTLSGVLADNGTGALSLVKNGGGIWQLSGANSYTGGVTLNAGELQVGNNAAFGTGGLTINSGTTISARTAARTLSNATTVNGNFTLGGTNQGGNLLTVSGTVDLTGGTRTITVDATGGAAISGVISNGGLTKAGTGALTLSASNTYTGATTVNAGTLTYGSNDVIADAGSVSVNNGSTLNIAGFTDTVAAVQLTSGSITGSGGVLTGSSFDVQSGTVSASLAGSGAALTKSTSGTVTLTANNTYTGTTSISAGMLLLSGSGTVNGSSGVTINGSGARLRHNGTTPGTVPITLTQGTLDGSGSLGAVTVTGAGGVVSNGTGVAGNTSTLTLSSLNSSAGGTFNLNKANDTTTVAIAVTGALNTSTANNTLNVVTVPTWITGQTYNLISYGSFSGTDPTAGTITGLGPRQTGTIGHTAATNGFITLLINGDQLRWTGAASTVWTTTPVGTPFNWKLVAAATDTEFMTNDDVIFDDTATTGQVDINDANVRPASATFNNSTLDYTVSGGFGIIDGTAGATPVIKNGTANVTFNTTNTYSGLTTITAGTLNVGNDSGLGSSTAATAGLLMNPAATVTATVNFTTGAPAIGSLASSGLGTSSVVLGSATTLTVGGSNTSTTFAGTISDGAGTAGLAKAGTGTLTLSGANSYHGDTNVNGGVLDLVSGGVINGRATNVGSAGQLKIDGGSLTSSGTGALSTINSGGTNGGFLLNSGSATFSSGLRTQQNDGALIKIAGGTLTATDINLRRTANSTAVATTEPTTGLVITAGTANLGTIEVGTNNSSASIYMSGGNLTTTGAVTVAQQTSGGRGGVISMSGGTFTVGDTTNGLVLVEQNGTSTNNQIARVGLSGGTMTLGKLSFGFNSSIGANSQAFMTVTGGANLYIGSGGVVDNSGGVFTTGTGSLSFTLDSSTLGAIADWSGSVPLGITNAATIQAADSVAAAHNILQSGVVSGTGQIVKTGAGTLSLSGNDTYSGGTQVNAGTLVVAHVNALGSGGLNIASGAVTQLQAGLSAPVQLSSLTITGGSALPGFADQGLGDPQASSLAAGGAAAPAAVQPVPEPASIVLAVAGLAGLLVTASRAARRSVRAS